MCDYSRITSIVFICNVHTVVSFISVLGLDIQDDLGRHEVGFVENTKKRPINSNEGCRVKANFKINKVSALNGIDLTFCIV